MIKNNLQKKIDERGIKKSWLAKEAGLHRNTITNLIKGADPRLSEAYSITKVLGLTVYDIWPSI